MKKFKLKYIMRNKVLINCFNRNFDEKICTQEKCNIEMYFVNCDKMTNYIMIKNILYI